MVKIGNIKPIEEVSICKAMSKMFLGLIILYFQ